jgi:hypothetical protein
MIKVSGGGERGVKEPLMPDEKVKIHVKVTGPNGGTIELGSVKGGTPNKQPKPPKK